MFYGNRNAFIPAILTILKNKGEQNHGKKINQDHSCHIRRHNACNVFHRVRSEKSLEAGSTWTVTGTSYLTGLSIDRDSRIIVPEGLKITMTVNGAKKAVKAGEYKGNIVITVTKS